MVSNAFSADDVIELINGDDSDFSGSESNGEEGEEVYIYRGPSFSVLTLSGAEALMSDASDFGKLALLCASSTYFEFSEIVDSLAFC